jgi:hypothetical protein
MKFNAIFFVTLILCFGGVAQAQPFASVPDASKPDGYFATLIINENPFPGERGFISVADTKAGMLAVLHVLDARLNGVPAGYKQQQISGVATTNIIDLIVAPHQCEGFFRDNKGNPSFAPRVSERLNNLNRIANSGGQPGRFAELLGYAQGLASAYMKGGLKEADRFAMLDDIKNVPVTGRAYSWMTDMDQYHPGGNFVKIPNDLGGAPGGNRFYTLRRQSK